MSSTSTVNGVVYHLISQLSETAEQQSDSTDNKEEGEEPVSPAQVPTRNLEDLESTVDQQSEQDASTRLAEFRQRKRTTITPSQKAILEEFYVGGMTSSGMQFTQLHQAASQKTGLSVRSVQLWIRNRRRPVCKNKGLVNSDKSLDTSPSMMPHASSSSPTINDNMATSSPLYMIDTTTDQIKIARATPQLTVSETAHPAILVKCRIANSFEEDFVEAEVPSLTYSALLQSCCEELEVESTTVAKIRKLPNTLVRKDRDVMRLNSLQELELVLHTALV